MVEVPGISQSSSVGKNIAAAIVVPIAFVIMWIVGQWVFWVGGAVLDLPSRIGLGPRGYDPDNIGFVQQLFRDILPAIAAMIGIGWVVEKFFLAHGPVSCLALAPYYSPCWCFPSR